VPESCLAWTPYHTDSVLDYLDLSCCCLVLFATRCVCGPVVVAEYLVRHPLLCMKQNGGTAEYAPCQCCLVIEQRYESSNQPDVAGMM